MTKTEPITAPPPPRRIYHVQQPFGISYAEEQGRLHPLAGQSLDQYAQSLRTLLSEASKRVMCLADLDQADSGVLIRAFILSVDTGSAVSILEAWQDPKLEQNSLGRMFVRVALWAQELGYPSLIAETGRGMDELISSWETVSELRTFAIPEDFENSLQEQLTNGTFRFRHRRGDGSDPATERVRASSRDAVDPGARGDSPRSDSEQVLQVPPGEGTVEPDSNGSGKPRPSAVSEEQVSSADSASRGRGSEPDSVVSNA